MRTKIAVVCEYPVITHRKDGYGNILFGLFGQLSKSYDVSFIQIVSDGLFKAKYGLNETFNIISFVQSQEIQEKIKERLLNQKGEERILQSIAFHQFAVNDKLLVEKLQDYLKEFELVFCAFPYSFRLVKSVYIDGKIGYLAMDGEYTKASLWSESRGKTAEDEAVVHEVFQIENECCRESDVVFTLTQMDAERLCEQYGISITKTLVIPAGLNRGEIMYTPPIYRTKDKAYTCKVLFISGGSWETVEAAEYLIQIAEELPAVMFYIVGMVGISLKEYSLQNVVCTGPVDEKEKIVYLETCDVALSIARQYYGSPTKVAEFMLAGIPIIATENGVRGYSLIPGHSYIQTEWETLANNIKRFCDMDIVERDRIAFHAYQYAMENRKWETIAMDATTRLRNIGILTWDDTQDVFIWGAGQAGKSNLSYAVRNKRRVLGFIDRNASMLPDGYCGYPVYAPEYLVDMHQISNHVIIATYTIDYTIEILRYLLILGYPAENIEMGYDNQLAFEYLDINRLITKNACSSEGEK